MHQDRSHGRADRHPDFAQRKEVTTTEEDAAIDFALLAVILDRHPTQLTIVELKRQMVDDPESFAQADAIDRAVRDLVGAGLLHRHGEFAIPTLAALRFDSLVNHWGHQ
jgi:hypothetical protein